MKYVVLLLLLACALGVAACSSGVDASATATAQANTIDAILETQPLIQFGFVPLDQCATTSHSGPFVVVHCKYGPTFDVNLTTDTAQPGDMLTELLTQKALALVP